MHAINFCVKSLETVNPLAVTGNKLIAILRFCLLLLVIIQLTGCAKSMSDLQAYVAQVNSREAPGIKPLPEIRPYRQFSYEEGNRRNPFDASIFESNLAAETARQSSDPTIRPDSNRTPEFLESFPLDSLKMVGTLSQDGQLWALIKTPDKTIQRVSSGNYLGQNNGVIHNISDAGIDLEEIIPDGYGGWQEKESYIALSE